MKLLLLLVIIWHLETPTSAHFDKKRTRFYNLTKERYFIDKTHFLGEFFQKLNVSKHLYFFTIPHKFGKTINAEMIRTFADIELDGTNRRNPNDTQAYEIFSKLSIGKNETIMKDHLANHPVILFDLQIECEKSWDSFFSSMQFYIKQIFSDYNFIYDLHKKNANATSDFQLMDKVFNSELNQNETSHSLKSLINIVGDFFNADVILLIDHYDFLVNYFSNSRQDIDRIYELINGMIFHIFDEGVPLRNSFVFGVSDLMFPTPMKYHRNISHFPFLGYNSAKYFGFTDVELSSLYGKYKFTSEDAMKMKIIFGDYISFERFKLYNPFSVVKFLNGVENENSSRFEIIQRKYCDQKDKFDIISSFMKSAEFRQTAILLLRHNRCNVGVINVFFESKNMFQIIENLKRNGSGVSFFDRDILSAHFFERGFIVPGFEENNSFMIPNLETDLDLRNKLKLFYMESKNMFVILQLLHVLKEIILCPSNAAVEIKQNLNRTMSELFEGLKQSEQRDFNHLDLIGIIYAFASDIDLWVFSQPIYNKIAFLKYENEHVMSDGEMLNQLTSVTSYYGSSVHIIMY
ncbi:uncharacterized protein LOC135844496 [Planococcus citri]|uniref:uncharacterized protein LOC135844496 n=1 Tax=Planococcus citri TaxID=170843 RepID=UPI0031F78F4C